MNILPYFYQFFYQCNQQIFHENLGFFLGLQPFFLPNESVLSLVFSFTPSMTKTYFHQSGGTLYPRSYVDTYYVNQYAPGMGELYGDKYLIAIFTGFMYTRSITVTDEVTSIPRFEQFCKKEGGSSSDTAAGLTLLNYRFPHLDFYQHDLDFRRII